METKLKTKYALYDGRFLENPYVSCCYETCETLKEARKNRKEYGDDTIIVKFQLKGYMMINHEAVN